LFCCSLNDVVKELEQLRAKSADFSLTRDAEITAVRKELSAKHLEALAQWRKESEERQKLIEIEVRSHFEGVLQGLKDQLDVVTKELDSLRVEYDRTANDYDESLKIRQVSLTILSLFAEFYY